MVAEVQSKAPKQAAGAGWEPALCGSLKDIRNQEAAHAVKMARIRAANMALFFFIMPVSSFITFAVVSIRTKGSLKNYAFLRGSLLSNLT